jgi:hypothetical protein
MNKEDFRQETRTQLDAIDSKINTHGRSVNWLCRMPRSGGE